MSTHVETITQIYQAFGKGDITSILNCLDENVAWEQWADNSSQKVGVPWMQAREGKGSITIVGGFAIKEFQLLSVMANESQVAIECVFEAGVYSIGGHYQDEEIYLWTFNPESKVVRMRHYSDMAKHIRAAQNSINEKLLTSI